MNAGRGEVMCQGSVEIHCDSAWLEKISHTPASDLYYIQFGRKLTEREELELEIAIRKHLDVQFLMAPAKPDEVK